MKNDRFLLGVELFFEKGIYQRYKNAKISLLTHQAATDHRLRLTYELFHQFFGEKIVLLFSPQHGLFSEKQANMIASPDEKEPLFNLTVKSLYGPRLKPDPEDLKKSEVLFVDLVDVGCRVYTYIWTLFMTMEVCNALGKEMVILDRPNPLGNTVEGPVLEKEYISFVGLDTLPMRHGLTIGEMAKLFQKRHFPNLDLKVIPMSKYSPSKLFPHLQRPWIQPSPNLPTFDSAYAYSGMVLLEGTNLSEGRGTTQPFLTFGAPFLKLKDLHNQLYEIFPEEEWGIYFKPQAFEPTFDKWQGTRCFGIQIHIMNYHRFSPVKFTLKLLKFIKETHEDFQLLPPPYEFERLRKPMEILLGNREILNWLKGDKTDQLEFLLKKSINEYLVETSSVRLYNDDEAYETHKRLCSSSLVLS
ncbi:MAG: DUF1343 domain-containing protein [Caldimicrobium sp.]|nr:DUF1343 domain-containing protein [Caldimicrobium sp.]MCX7613045.1 DUF1343 domain-containing protein [Caldimicrobium sp.]MDW8182804.1 DUF1343 domain-containing protein [Caldimicrobium sp.]